MSMCRRFHGAPVERLIVSVPADVVRSIDSLIGGQFGFGGNGHAANGNRSEFIRLAIAEKLERDLMISAHYARTRARCVPAREKQETPANTGQEQEGGGRA